MAGHGKHEAVLIDVDGTLLDSNGAHALAWTRAFRRYGYDVDFERVRRFIGMGGDKILKAIDPKLDDEGEPGKWISELRGRIFLDRYVSSLPPTPGARALLVHLGSAGFKRIVATSAKRQELDALLKTAGVADQIDTAVTSDDAQRSKPDTDILESALQRGRVGRDRAVYLGDTPYDVEAARRAEVCCIALRCGGWDDRDLADADATYDNPADLLAHIEDSPL
ncbi:MAG: HAD family hydrolase [Candidatus Eremiobacteraeota bacterium]|nr:HAD family hydrolase [Candidatus Eremiobacteraeota bacterium]